MLPVSLFLVSFAYGQSGNRIYCDLSHYCKSPETCCASSTSNWMCCPYASATCCSDEAHCCPISYPVCNASTQSCDSGGILSLFYDSKERQVFLENRNAVSDTFDARDMWPLCVDQKGIGTDCGRSLYSPISVVYDRLCIALGQDSLSRESAVSALSEAAGSCDFSLYDFAVSYVEAVSLPGESGPVRGRVEHVQLTEEMEVKRKVMKDGPVAIKASGDILGKIIGWTDSHWITLEPMHGAEVLLPISSTSGEVMVYEIRK